ISANGIAIVGARHLFTAGLRTRRANTLNPCAPTLAALCVEKAFASIRMSLFSMTDDFSAQSCRITGGIDGETDRTPTCYSRKPFILSNSFPRANSHVALYARLPAAG